MKKYILIPFFLMFLSRTVFAGDTIFVSEKKDFIAISRHSEYFFDKSGKLTLTDFLLNPQQFDFQKTIIDNPNFGITGYDLWFRFTIKNVDKKEVFRFLEVNYATLGKIYLHITEKGKLVETKYGGMDFLYEKSDVDFREPVFELSVPPGKTYEFYMKIETTSLQIVPISLYSPRFFFENKPRQSMPVLLLLGILIAAVFYNLIYFFITRERVYFYFSLGLFFTFLFYMFFHGYFFDFNLGIPPLLRTKFRMLSYAFGSVFLLQFSVLYLETKMTFKQGHYILLISIIYFLLYIPCVMFEVLPLAFLNRLTITTYPLFALVQFVIGIIALIKKQKQAIYFVATYGVFMFGTVLHFLFAYGIVEQNLYLKHSSLANMAIFAVILSAGLSEKILNVRKEKTRADQLKFFNQSLQNEIVVRTRVEKELYEYKKNLEETILTRTSELSQSEQKYRELIEQLHDWIWQINDQGIFVFSNNAVENILGYKSEEIVNHDFDDFFSTKQVEDIRNMILASGRAEEGFTGYISFTHNKSGEQVYLETAGKPIYNISGKYQGYRGITKNITDKKNIERRILKAMLETEEKERKRFAIELHDGLGATLSGINMYLNTIRSDELDENIKNILLEKVQKLVKLAASDARSIANNMRPFELSYLGLKASIENLCQRIAAPEKLNILLNIPELNARIDSDYQLIIFRIISELINNSIKHSECRNIKISIIETEKKLNLEFRNDGNVFDFHEKIKSGGGSGLQNIVTRLNTINGTIDFSAREGVGVVFSIEIALEEPV